MPAYADSWLAIVDSRVVDGQPKLTKMGTVTGRASGSLSPNGPHWASVALDGSSGTGQPVKCPGSVIVDVGDRVGLIRYEGEWIITINYTLRTLGAGSFYSQLTADTTTSGTFVDLASGPTVVMKKYRDETMLSIDLSISMYYTFGSDSATTPELACSLLSEDLLTTFDQVLVRMTINPRSVHTMITGGATTAAIPGGQNYTCVARWRRAAGVNGTLTTDTNDYITFRVREVIQ